MTTHPSFRARAAEALGSAAARLERHPGLAVLLLLVLYVPCVLDLSRTSPITHDELFTVYISGAPTLRMLWVGLRDFDLNPPLAYLLTRLTGHLEGSGALGLRLPEMAGFLVFLLAIFRFVRVRMGTVYGLLTAVLLMGSVLWELAALARPYALLLGFLALALVGWQMAAGEDLPATTNPSRRRAGGLVLLGLAVCGMLFSHIFAVLSLGSLLGAELWRGQLRGRRDRAVLLTMAVPLLSLPAYLPMLRSHGKSIFPPAFQPGGTTIFEFYIGTIARELVALCLTALCVRLLLGAAHLRGGRDTAAPGWFFTSPEWCAIILLLACPLLLMGELMATHGAFFARYGATASLAVALLTTALLARWTLLKGRPDARPALLGCVVVVLMSGLAASWTRAFAHGTIWPTRAHSEPAMLPCRACLRTADPGLPLVDGSGLTFVQMTHYESDATMRRVFYLTDGVASERYAHANIFERMGELVEHFHLRGNVESYPEFIQEHPHFFVFGRFEYPEDWLLRKLVADGADVRLIEQIDDSYRDTELYEVTLPARRR